MKEKQSIPGDFLDNLNFHPCPCKDFLNPAGQCFEPDPAVGEGYYWYYERPGMFAVGIMDLRPLRDYVTEYQQPDFISINYFDTITAEELSPYRRLKANCIRGHVSNGEVFRARYHRNMPIRGVELILAPGYYHDYLENQYPGEFPDPRQAFLSIDGSTDFPELVLIFKQITRFQGTGAAAELYYGGKAAEALSLIIERTRQQPEKTGTVSLSRQDLDNLDGVRSYIEDHFAFELRAEQLAAIACMGQTKLRSTFKQVYGSTITEYIQSRRIAHGEYLLRMTDFTVARVAEAVGYHHPGRFSTLFKKSTGLYPDEYRKLMGQAVPAGNGDGGPGKPPLSDGVPEKKST